MLQDHYEDFTENQLKILQRYVTNTSSYIFALKNLPEVIKGALFSRYSRSSLGLRSLLLKEFIGNDEETAFATLAGSGTEDEQSVSSQNLALQKAQNFYDRILDGYGDDSIGELGGAHLAIENISMLAANQIEDSRIGGSPLEKSTRYIYFDQKVRGEYLFYREPVLMTSAYKQIYLDTCNFLFDTYSKLIPKLTAYIGERMPKDPETSKAAYTAALRAKVLDCLRGLLPAGALTNMGMYGNGRFFEQLLHKLQTHNLSELQEIGKNAFEELAKVIPSFVRRANPSHKTHLEFQRFFEAMRTEIEVITDQNTAFSDTSNSPGVHLIDYDRDSVLKVAAAILYPYSDKGLHELQSHCETLSDEDLSRVLDSACSARENRRQKSPRALEHANFAFEILADFGAFRDLHRHRILTQQRQLLTCNYGYYIPDEIVDTEFEDDYTSALETAREAYRIIALELPEEAQYIVPMAYRNRWYFNVNLRALQWICELRSSPAGHPSYRRIAQEMAKAVTTLFPQFERFFKFVDYDGYELGRLEQEQRKEERRHPGSSLLA